MRTLLALCVCLAGSSAAAQTTQAVAWPVAPNSRVRVESPVLGPGVRTGTVVQATTDSLVFRTAAEDVAVTVPTPNIVKLEVAKGTHTRKARGAFIGLLIGAGAGAVIGAASYKKDDCTEICIFPDSRAFEAEVGAGLLGILGAVVGTVVGAHAFDTWVPVALPGR